MAKQKKEAPAQPLEKILWQTADKLCNANVLSSCRSKNKIIKSPLNN